MLFTTRFSAKEIEIWHNSIHHVGYVQFKSQFSKIYQFKFSRSKRLIILLSACQTMINFFFSTILLVFSIQL